MHTSTPVTCMRVDAIYFYSNLHRQFKNRFGFVSSLHPCIVKYLHISKCSVKICFNRRHISEDICTYFWNRIYIFIKGGIVRIVYVLLHRDTLCLPSKFLTGGKLHSQNMSADSRFCLSKIILTSGTYSLNKIRNLNANR